MKDRATADDFGRIAYALERSADRMFAAMPVCIGAFALARLSGIIFWPAATVGSIIGFSIMLGGAFGLLVVGIRRIVSAIIFRRRIMKTMNPEALRELRERK